MTESGTETGFGARNKDPSDRVRMERRMPLVLLGLLAMSVMGRFVLGGHWAEIIVNHMGGLAIVGLLACLAGFIAKKKGRDYRRAFVSSVVLPVILGAAAVVLVYFLAETVYCGGGVILAAALIMITIYSCLKKKKPARV